MNYFYVVSFTNSHNHGSSEVVVVVFEFNNVCIA